MKVLGISFDELCEIYARNGHQIKQPNSVKAINEAINIAMFRVWELLDKRFNDYNAALLALSTEVEVLKAQLQNKVARAVPNLTMSGRCYCGTLITDQACGTCGRKYA
jgi:hypothetical protein